jgi:competence protein ComEA
MDTAPMKTTMTAVALALALGSSAYAQEVKPSMTPAAPAATTAPAAKPADTTKPAIAPQSMQKVGAPTVPATAPKVEAKPAVTPPAATKTAAPAAAKLLNINTVSAADLEKLPKIGEARAKLIVAGRPYKSVEDLMSKKVIPQDAFDAVKGLVTTQ